ncbi:ribbon-helix-helix domain-containing protein [Limnoglobus roseus]|uniref:Type II toxin-antitoxin system ParD family antitoxin n=1 Tax=Limnoglobus roseus TaxID=2598579 RepID=A0A5C1A7Y3_9BACT|nr:hypothetical protein [Limnoglobus roseus]QEL13234.1 hypothetical protein PX52LOC_00088 [Limnoglobus roseus]
MTITLPDDVRIEAEAKARELGFATVEEYVIDLVRSDEPGLDVPPSGGYQPKNRAALERLLDEGMASGEPIVVDEAFWEERRRVLAERLAQKNGRKS